MKKRFQVVPFVVFSGLVLGTIAWGQGGGGDEFMLDEITVTAEKRSANLQDLPSAVSAMPGDDLITQSKVTTAQILDSVPNVTFRDGGGLNPNGNIAIRGIQRTQVAKGIDDALPSTTAVYVDGVYQGVGGNYDINRVEVLRGPQGTLYGRSATGGVISFYTNDPKLEEFGGNVTAEFGSDALVNIQGAVNVPVGEKVALRAAAHYYSRDGYYDDEGGATETKEGRIKVLYQPTDAFDIVLHASMQEIEDWDGGWVIGLDRDDASGKTWNYHYQYTDAAADPTKEYRQFGATANYDFGDAILTWVGGYHDYDQSGDGVEGESRYGYGRTDSIWPKNWYHTQELRLASDTDGRFTWLVGANYFQQEFENEEVGVQTRITADSEVPADMFDVLQKYRWADGKVENYGIFTEESFEVRDDFRITAGLRYDYTDFIQSMVYMTNQNMTALNNYLSPEIWAVGSIYDDQHTWENVTYKLRFDYDLTPDNLVYLTTATGFVPGFAAIGPQKQGGVIYGWEIRVLDEQKLTSYELGSKNQFLNNTLRVNSALFYYDVEGYPEVFELMEVPGPSIKSQKETPITVIGVDLEVEYLPTMHDKLSLTAGWQRVKLDDWKGSITWLSGNVTDANAAAILKLQPGHPQLEASLAYDHTFALKNGSTLVPRAELHYTGRHYLTQMTVYQDGWGGRPYNRQDAYMLCNANLSWTSPSQAYTINAWVRNALDERYKAATDLGGIADDGEDIDFEPGDPRTFGIMFSAKF